MATKEAPGAWNERPRLRGYIVDPAESSIREVGKESKPFLSRIGDAVRWLAGLGDQAPTGSDHFKGPAVPLSTTAQVERVEC